VGELLGPNFVQHLLLALSAGLVIGNVVALVRPPAGRAGADGAVPQRPPLRRSLVMIGLGSIVSLWVLLTLFR
jgi:hypothetical protein